MLSELTVSNFRNITNAKLSFSSRFNLISGDNGAGKSTILEAIHLLGHGRSFRSRYTRDVLKSGERFFRVEGKTFSGRTLEVMKGAGKTAITINKKTTNKKISLHKELPVFTFHPNCHSLLQGSPKSRLELIDRNLFHVKQNFGRVWHNFYRALRQRNLALKRNESSFILTIWDKKTAELGGYLTAARKEYVFGFVKILRKLEIFSNFSKPLRINYHPGWDESLPYCEVLYNCRKVDRHFGYTKFGPHRANMEVLWEDRDAAKVASRGQQKLIVYMLILATGIYFNTAMERNSIFLVDDLDSELDKEKQAWMIEELKKTQGQVFFTSTNKNFLSRAAVENNLVVMKEGEVAVPSRLKVGADVSRKTI